MVVRGLARLSYFYESRHYMRFCFIQNAVNSDYNHGGFVQLCHIRVLSKRYLDNIVPLILIIQFFQIIRFMKKLTPFTVSVSMEGLITRSSYWAIIFWAYAISINWNPLSRKRPSTFRTAEQTVLLPWRKKQYRIYRSIQSSPPYCWNTAWLLSEKRFQEYTYNPWRPLIHKKRCQESGKDIPYWSFSDFLCSWLCRTRGVVYNLRPA